MKDLKYTISLKSVKLLNVILLTIAFSFCWIVYYANVIDSPYHAKGNMVLISIFVIIYAICGKMYEAFLISINRIGEMICSQILAVFVTDFIMFIIISLLTRAVPNILPIIILFLSQIFIIIIWCVVAHVWYFNKFPPKRSAIIYDEYRDMEKLINEYGMSKKYNVLVTAEASECINNYSMLDGLELVFLCGIHSHERNIILKHCVSKGICAFVIPRIGDTLMSGAKRMHLFHLPILRVDRFMPSPEFLFIKRFFDMVISSVALLIFFIPMLFTALAVKLYDGGPVFYKQCRLTKRGESFYILKFRSMRVNAELDGVARLSSGKNDERITPVGRFIRKCRLDELPQFINILKGDMSLVGPRPERPEIAKQYENELPEFSLRLQVKAGLTGYAQVYGKYNTAPYDKLQMDLMYIANPSLLEDLRILFLTVKILFLKESTDGVVVGQLTAASNNNKETE